MQRKKVTHKTAYIRDGNGFRYTKNRQEKYENKGKCVSLVTTHERHKEMNGTRYTITQTATASRPELLAEWANGSKGTFSADGLTFVTVTEI